MSLPTIEQQTRTQQRKFLADKQNWKNYVWIMALVVPAAKYGRALPGAKVWVPGTFPTPYVPFVPVTADDPQRTPLLTLMLEFMAHDATVPLVPALIPADRLEAIQDNGYVLMRWPYQLGLVHVDIVCRTCGLVTQADGFEMSYGAIDCAPAWCSQHSQFSNLQP